LMAKAPRSRPLWWVFNRSCRPAVTSVYETFPIHRFTAPTASRTGRSASASTGPGSSASAMRTARRVVQRLTVSDCIRGIIRVFAADLGSRSRIVRRVPAPDRPASGDLDFAAAASRSCSVPFRSVLRGFQRATVTPELGSPERDRRAAPIVRAAGPRDVGGSRRMMSHAGDDIQALYDVTPDLRHLMTEILRRDPWCRG